MLLIPPVTSKANKIMQLSLAVVLILLGIAASETPCEKVMQWADGHYQGYNGLCLGFCNAAWEHVGKQEACLQQESAKDAAIACSQESRWHSWAENSDPPASAVVLFECCNCPSNPYGHACLSDGRHGCLSQGGVGNHSFSWYRSDFCNVDPKGWILPENCGPVPPPGPKTMCGGVPDGWYCGGDIIYGGNANTLYFCSKGENTEKKVCAHACAVVPGENDICVKGQCSATQVNGWYCGDDEIVDGDKDVLYFCQNHTATRAEKCLHGCDIKPHVNDVCAS